IDKVKKYGPLYDIKILFLTVGRVFSMSDVSETPENMAKNEAMKNGQEAVAVPTAETEKTEIK
ncbi:MAG: hypothetical protein J6B55_03580, partial [Clostridia bacterium]|nr:hypothetical protein [Clostridia bacterium]